MDGPQVRRAQRALLHNPYGTFDPGPLDGVYGERTAAAVRRAKYWMGFPEQKIDQVCGSDLLTLLAEESPLSSSLKSMRTRRLRRAEDAQLWGAAYDAAVSCVGDREEPPAAIGATSPSGTGFRGRGARCSCRGASSRPARRRSSPGVTTRTFHT